MISDGAEIVKRLPRVMPKPTAHIIDWFHIAMKIQPMQQIADHLARSRPHEAETSSPIARRIRAVKWHLWHGRVDRAIRDLQELLDGLKPADQIEDLPTSRLRSLGAQLLTYVASNRSAIINYSKRCRAGLRVASTLAESAVNSIVGKRLAKSQQMRWSVRGAHIGELRDRLRAEFRKPDPRVPSAFRPKPPILRAA